MLYHNPGSRVWEKGENQAINQAQGKNSTNSRPSASRVEDVKIWASLRHAVRDRLVRARVEQHKLRLDIAARLRPRH